MSLSCFPLSKSSALISFAVEQIKIKRANLRPFLVNRLDWSANGCFSNLFLSFHYVNVYFLVYFIPSLLFVLYRSIGHVPSYYSSLFLIYPWAPEKCALWRFLKVLSNKRKKCKFALGLAAAIKTGQTYYLQN